MHYPGNTGDGNKAGITPLAEALDYSFSKMILIFF